MSIIVISILIEGERHERNGGCHRAGWRGEDLPKRAGRVPRAGWRGPGHYRGRDGGDHGPVGQRQDDNHQSHRRHRPAHGWHGDSRRLPARPDDREPARSLARPHYRHRLPVLPADAHADGGRERRAPAGPGSARPGAGAQVRGEAPSRLGRTRRPRRPAAAGTVRRGAAARRVRQGDGLRAADPARRRTHWQPRHGPGPGDVRADQRPERKRNHGRVRHARPGSRRAGIPDRVRSRWPDRRRYGAAAVSTLNRKAWGDLTRHRTRTFLAVGTLCIAIASLGFLAVPSLLNAAMNRQVADSHLYDVGISTRVLDLTPAQLSALGHLPGVAAVSPAVGYATTATSAAGAQNIEIAGTDLASAPVNTVPLLTGRMPGLGEVLADAGNGQATGFAVPNGGTIDVRASSGRLVRLRVSGTWLNLYATPGANGSTTPVFYASTATVQALRGARGYNYLGV